MGTHLLKVDHHFNNRCFKAFLPPPKAREFFPQSLENMGGCASKPKESVIEPVSADSAAVTALQNPEDKVETAAIATTVVTKEEVKEKEKEKVAEAKVEDKSDAPLVTL